jgi:hypothetical protein
MNGKDFGVSDERHAGEGDDGPVAGIEDEQGDKAAEKRQAVDFGEPGMRGGEFLKTREADQDAAGFREQDQRDQPDVFMDNCPAEDPCDQEDEQIVDDVGDAVVATEGRGGDAKFAGEDAVKNIRERAGEQDWQINPARNICQCAGQRDGAEQESQGGEGKWQMAIQKATRVISLESLRHFERCGDTIKNRRVAVKKNRPGPGNNLKSVIGIRIDVKAVFHIEILHGRGCVISEPGMRINLDGNRRGFRTL